MKPASFASPGLGRLLVLLCSTLAAATPASAQMFRDSSLQALLGQERPAELQRVARERLAARPDDSQAVLALALGALENNDAESRKLAIQHARSCTQQQPRAAECHYALGVVLGVQAMSEGMLKAARSAGTVKEALAQAQTLEPAWYPARSALVEFYLLAPGMMGGSSARAQELARAAPSPAQAKVLQARVDLQDGKSESVLQSLTGLLSSPDAAVAEDAAEWGFGAALMLVNEGKAPLAQPFLEQLMRARPDHAAGPFGLARVRAAAGAHAEALVLYEQSARAQGAARLPVDYRRGIALQELGRKDEARAALARFVKAGRGHKLSLEDARKRLAELGG